MKWNRGWRAFMAVVGITGIALLVCYSNWQTATGVFLCIFAHNIERHFPTGGEG